MTLRHLKIFVSVCDNGTVTAAAEKLYLAQPSVSLAVAELESYYGVHLFDRISRKLYLTEVGKQFLGYARHIISLFDEMEKGIRDWESTGLLRVGSSITLGTRLMPRVVKSFSKIHPQVSVHLTVENSEHVERKILTNEIDFALIEGNAHSGQIICETFQEDQMYLFCGRGHPLYTQTQVSWEELSSDKFLLREKGSGTRDLFDSVLTANGLSISPSWESTSVEALIGAVEEGIGVTVLPYRMAEREVECGNLHPVSITGLEFHRDLQIIYHHNKYLSPVAKDFIELCRRLSGPLASKQQVSGEGV